MTDDKSRPRRFRPFEDGHALTYTIREVNDTGREYQSQHRDLAAAADAFALACQQAACVELRDTNGRVLAGYVRGQRQTGRTAA
jgi:hypothetical protein